MPNNNQLKNKFFIFRDIFQECSPGVVRSAVCGREVLRPVSVDTLSVITRAAGSAAPGPSRVAAVQWQGGADEIVRSTWRRGAGAGEPIFIL